mgnify:CR=1 FL=1
MTVTSLDNFGHASGAISMSELRTYYGRSGAVSLSGSLSGSSSSVPSSLPRKLILRMSRIELQS